MAALDEESPPNNGIEQRPQLDETVPTQSPTNSSCCNSNRLSGLTFVVLLFTTIALGVYLAMSNEDGDSITPFNNGETNNNNNGDVVVAYDDRVRYYQELQETIRPFIDSPQDQAIEWLAFKDILLQQGDGDWRYHQRLWQRFTLVTLYFAHSGPSTWKVLNEPSSGWIQHGVGVHECDWRGIDCNTSREVVGIRLSGRQGITLTGEQMTTELGILSSLSYLDLSSNRLRGSIPPEWATLTNLELLDLSDNQLSSFVPPYLGGFSNLKTLILAGNQFTGDFPTNELLSPLEKLELQNNPDLHGRLDEFLLSIPSLEFLDLSLTMISGTFPSQTVSNLEVLKLWGAQVTGTLPTEIGTWTSLEKLNLRNLQKFQGTLPTELGLLTNLDSLTIGYVSNMEGPMPTELGLLTKLTELELKMTSRVGTLPAEYGELTGLMLFDVSFNNGITGTVPSEYGHWSNIKNIYIEATNLRGSIGPELCALDFTQFWADCKADELSCSCCTQCKNAY